jgi:hypothetical protein
MPPLDTADCRSELSVAVASFQVLTERPCNQQYAVDRRTSSMRHRSNHARPDITTEEDESESFASILAPHRLLKLYDTMNEMPSARCNERSE